MNLFICRDLLHELQNAVGAHCAVGQAELFAFKASLPPAWEPALPVGRVVVGAKHLEILGVLGASAQTHSAVRVLVRL